MLTGKSILVTGGTGSFGKELTRTILTRYPDIRRLVIYSRDELKQFDMSQQFPESKHHQMRYFIGDVRDKERLYRALEGIDIVVHAAALKQVPAAEYNPFEAVKTNVTGAAKHCRRVSIQRQPLAPQRALYAYQFSHFLSSPSLILAMARLLEVSTSPIMDWLMRCTPLGQA